MAVAHDLLHPRVVHQWLQHAPAEEVMEDPPLCSLGVGQHKPVRVGGLALVLSHVTADERVEPLLLASIQREQLALAQAATDLLAHTLVDRPFGRRGEGVQRHAETRGRVGKDAHWYSLRPATTPYPSVLRPASLASSSLSITLASRTFTARR